MTFRIVSYNLLVPKFATQEGYYDHSDSSYLQTEYRWNLIQQQLEKEMKSNRNTILCFQELSKTLIKQLKSFLSRHSYKLFESLYGKDSHDFMGVGIAVPKEIHVDWVQKIRIGTELQSSLTTKRKHSSRFSRFLCCSRGTTNENLNPSWENAINRRNVMIIVKLIVDKNDLYLGNYHMPCAYRDPNVMFLHASYVKDLIFDRSKGKPFVLAGDFNIMPTSDVYHCLTGKKDNGFAQIFEDFPFRYRPNQSQVLKSAYLEKNGSEPNYTNYAHTNTSERFCATLDYLFFSGEILVESVLDLPSEPTGESYPDQNNPSDHLMIAATFQFRSTSQQNEQN